MWERGLGYPRTLDDSMGSGTLDKSLRLHHLMGIETPWKMLGRLRRKPGAFIALGEPAFAAEPQSSCLSHKGDENVGRATLVQEVRRGDRPATVVGASGYPPLPGLQPGNRRRFQDLRHT